MKRLAPFVEELRRDWPGRAIPGFDPKDGASGAKILFLLEAPGPRALVSNLISRDNNDKTAANFNALLAEAEIERTETALWNVVPWYIGNADRTKIRPARVSDLREADAQLVKLLHLLPALRAVVLVGRKARHKSVRLLIEREAPDVEVFECFHPSPLVLNGRPQNRQKILEVLLDVRGWVDSSQQPGQHLARTVSGE